MKRVEALEALAGLGDPLVCNLGYASRELYHAADRPSNFYMMGSMGLASSIGLGLALARRRRVLAVDGDGSVLMNLGGLSTLAHFGPPNLVVVILDNAVHGSTGNQPSHTALGTDLAEVARASGVASVARVNRVPDLLAAVRSARGPAVVLAQVEEGNEDVPTVPLAPPALRDRFMAHLEEG
ncbi:MAG: thiamine pyrophosphate-dependent enzyme [Thermoplasmata archaeon]